METSLSRPLLPIETQFRADWVEPGSGARASMDCINSQSEGGAGDDEMVPSGSESNCHELDSEVPQFGRK